MRVATETLSQLTNLMAIVSAPPIQTATVRHVEVLLLQPQVLMVVVITSTGGVSKRVLTFERSVDPTSIRFLDWQHPNDLTLSSWGERSTSSSAIWNSLTSVPRPMRTNLSGFRRPDLMSCARRLL